MSIKKLTLGMWRAMLLCEVGVGIFSGQFSCRGIELCCTKHLEGKVRVLSMGWK